MKNNFAKNGVSSELLQKQPYNSARANLLLVLIFSLINILLLVTNSQIYFLFSAAVPYLLVDLGMLLCGMYPPEFYENAFSGFPILPPVVFYVLLGMAALVLLFYLFAFIFSAKNRVGWLIFALVFFSLDTLVLVLSADLLGALLDLAFHVMVIVLLAKGIHGHYKNKAKAAAQPAPAPWPTAEESDAEGEVEPASCLPESLPRRAADMTVKARTLLAFEVYGHRVLYRRVKKTNELVVDGYVYDEYVARFERGHVLTAVIDGHEITAGFDGFSASCGAVDGMLVAREMRLL